MVGVCRNLPDQQYPTTLFPPEIPVNAMNDDLKPERLELDQSVNDSLIPG